MGGGAADPGLGEEDISRGCQQGEGISMCLLQTPSIVDAL